MLLQTAFIIKITLLQEVFLKIKTIKKVFGGGNCGTRIQAFCSVQTSVPINVWSKEKEKLGVECVCVCVCACVCGGSSEKGITGHLSNLHCLSDSENISLNIYIDIAVYSSPPHTYMNTHHHTHTHTITHTHAEPVSPYLLLFSIYHQPPHILVIAGRGTITS